MMNSNITLSGVAVVGMPGPFLAPAARAGWPAAHAAIAPQPRRRIAAANRASVDWSPF